MNFLSNKITGLLGRKSVKNVFWLSLDKFFKLGVSILVGAWASRFYGPVDLGKVNYINAYIAIFLTIATLGMDSFLVKEILSDKAKPSIILGSAFFLRMTSAIIIFIAGFIFFEYANLGSDYIGLYIFLSFTVVCSPFDLIDIEYQSILQSKKTVIAKNSAYLVGAVCKFWLLYNHKPIIYYAAALGLETLLAYIILIAQYHFTNKSGVFSWRIDFSTAKHILVKAWPFTVAGLSVMLYMRVDQIMIGSYLTVKEVGEFSGAVRISELFTFIPMAITSSYFATLMKSVNSDNRIEFIKKNQTLFNLLLLAAFCISLVIFLFAKPLILLLLGHSFYASISILRVYIWCLVAIFLGVATGPYFTIENLQKISLYKTILGLFINISFNVILIPAFGAVGAAYATLISQFFTSILSNLLFTKTRVVFYWQMKSFRSLFLFKIKDFKF